ncbi:MAG: glucose 1-dehydrogenase [Verrucomicrobia bacterium]|nr:glucose 1-dehydrogenase [Verrucomicrobiota bacterium]
MSRLFERLFSLKGRVALITGASGGIGRALAIAFAEAGAVVAVHGVSKDKIETTQQLIKKVGGRSAGFAEELRDTKACRSLVATVAKQLKRLDILINCAGTNRRKPIRAITEEDYDFITSINLRSVFFLCQAAYPIMRDQGGGKIINVGSISSTDGLGGVSVYGATKAAVAQLTKTMALEWAKDNIQVNCLAPGFLMTPLTEAGLWGDPHRRQWLLDRIPAGRPGKPEELVGAALLLASNASSYLTGQILNVDGGYLAGGSWLLEGE